MGANPVSKSSFVVAANMRANKFACYAYLDSLGIDNWGSDAESDEDFIVEFAGRLCYMSFGTDFNPNITKIRSENAQYIANILAVNHGSVLEHVSFSFILENISRVLTAELERHRVGIAYSEMSLRYFRLDEGFNYYLPESLQNNSDASIYFTETMDLIAQRLKTFIDLLDIDNKPFEVKKQLTSIARRIAPLGMNTRVFWTCNVRELRHILAMRTAPEAEEEIRNLFCKIGAYMVENWPILFGDMKPSPSKSHYK